jgi:hypothetical protein
MNPYEKLMARKRKWTPVQTSAGTCKQGAEEAIFRALALRHMELPVGDFITDALNSEVPALAREILASNVKDDPTLKMKKTMTSHLVTSPMLTVLIRKLRRKPLGLRPLGRHIQITRSRKPWSLSVRFSSFFYHSSALMVTLG